MVDALLESLAAVSPGVMRIAGAESGASGFGGRTAAATGKISGLTPPQDADDPMLCLMLWAAMLADSGELDARLLQRAGLDAAKLAELSAQHPRELAHLRQLRLAGAVFSREALAGLLRARLSEMLMGARKPSELLALTKMMERMPQWMWGQEQLSAIGGQPSAGEEAAGLGEDGLAALQLLSEMLNAKQSETSDEEVAEMLLRASQLADRLDPEGAYIPAPQRPRVHKQAYAKKRQRRQ